MPTFTPQQEARIREIAREEAMNAALAMGRLQAARAAGMAIDRHRVFEKDLAEALASGVVEGPKV